MEKWLADALKKFPCTELDGGIIRTTLARASFSKHLFEPQPDKKNPGKKGKYGITLLFPTAADLSVLKRAHAKMQAESFPNHKGKLYNPFRDQGEKGHIGGYVEGALFISARTEQRPTVQKFHNGKRVNVQDAEDLYPGCWVLASVHLFKFVSDEQKGVTFGLNNVLKVRDDEPFGGGSSDPDADFAGAVDLNDGAAMTADDLM